MYTALPSCRVNSSAPLVCRHDRVTRETGRVGLVGRDRGRRDQHIQYGILLYSHNIGNELLLLSVCAKLRCRLVFNVYAPYSLSGWQVSHSLSPHDVFRVSIFSLRIAAYRGAEQVITLWSVDGAIRGTRRRFSLHGVSARSVRTTADALGGWAPEDAEA